MNTIHDIAVELDKHIPDFARKNILYMNDG